MSESLFSKSFFWRTWHSSLLRIANARGVFQEERGTILGNKGNYFSSESKVDPFFRQPICGMRA